MSHKSIFGHDENITIDPCTFQPICVDCQKLWNIITPEAMKELYERERKDKIKETPQEAYDRAMKGL
jgi:hypothetical protein